MGAAHFPRFFDPFGGKLKGISPIGLVDLVEHLHRAAPIGRRVEEVGLVEALEGEIIEDHPHFFIAVAG